MESGDCLPGVERVCKPTDKIWMWVCIHTEDYSIVDHLFGGTYLYHLICKMCKFRELDHNKFVKFVRMVVSREPDMVPSLLATAIGCTSKFERAIICAISADLSVLETAVFLSGSSESQSTRFDEVEHKRHWYLYSIAK
jgi:hypothetical protein